jgi:hypothetical protein
VPCQAGSERDETIREEVAFGSTRTAVAKLLAIYDFVFDEVQSGD